MIDFNSNGFFARLKKVNNGEFGLSPDMKNKKRNGVRMLIDDNFEDRLILAQVAVLTKQGKQNAQYISCSQSDEAENNRKVIDLYNESKRVEEQGIAELDSQGDSEFATFVHINGKDFGKRSTSRKNSDAVGKNRVAQLVETALKEFFEEDGGLEVVTPDEMGY